MSVYGTNDKLKVKETENSRPKSFMQLGNSRVKNIWIFMRIMELKLQRLDYLMCLAWTKYV